MTNLIMWVSNAPQGDLYCLVRSTRQQLKNQIQRIRQLPPGAARSRRTTQPVVWINADYLYDLEETLREQILSLTDQDVLQISDQDAEKLQALTTDEVRGSREVVGNAQTYWTGTLEDDPEEPRLTLVSTAVPLTRLLDLQRDQEN